MVDGRHLTRLGLRAVADAMSASVRREDTVYWIGGDEFAVLLPDANARQAERVMARTSMSSTQIWSNRRARSVLVFSIQSRRRSASLALSRATASLCSASPTRTMRRACRRRATR